jgi:signal transduction histidine kinase
VTVRDNGRGISGDDMAKPFKMSRRLDAQNVPGEGMGLAYVKALVRRHGRISCESEPGKGTAFMFTIPHVFEQDATSAAAGREP